MARLGLLLALGVSVFGQMTPAYRQRIVAEHNRLRAGINGTGSAEIAYDMNLEAVAQAYLDTTVAGQFKHSENAARGTAYATRRGVAYDSTVDAVGENWASTSPDTASSDWCDYAMPTSVAGVQCSERSCYTHIPSSCSMGCTTGHYTQVTWAKSLYVGCGYTAAKGTVCMYYPAGNCYGETPYTVGTACSACPSQYSTCRNGLCATTSTCTASTCDSNAVCQVMGDKSCRCKPGFMGEGTPGNCKPAACEADPGYCPSNSAGECSGTGGNCTGYAGTVAPGTKCLMTCDEGNTLTAGSLTRTCGSDGQWSQLDATCDKVSLLQRNK